MRIAFIGFGEAGQAFQRSLAEHDSSLTFAAYDILLGAEGPTGACRSAMMRAGVEVAETVEAAVSGADWVISAVTADEARNAAQAAAPFLRAGQVFIDINSISPDGKRANAQRVMSSGASYLDMAVMAPVHPRAHRTPVLIAGPMDEAPERRLRALEFQFEHVGDAAGGATAIKMVRSLFVKGLEALTVETLLAAEASGCLERIMDSLGKSYPGLGWPDFAEYEFERVLKHGVRRAAEMRESARTLDELGLHGRLADAIAEVHNMTAAAGRDLDRSADLRRIVGPLAQKRTRDAKGEAGPVRAAGS